jgi:hypothetical protein
MAIAIAHFVDSHFLESAAAENRAAQATPQFSPAHWMRAAAVVNLDRIEEARTSAQRVLDAQPRFTITSIVSAPFANPEIQAALGNALRRVGLPE